MLFSNQALLLKESELPFKLNQYLGWFLPQLMLYHNFTFLSKMEFFW